jgi:hypothetical protein
MSGSNVDHNYIRQIKEPSVAKGYYPKDFKGVQDAFDKFFPEALGYLVGYGFTGLGDPTKHANWSKESLGFEGKKQRVLGANYFVKTPQQCSPSSVPNCVQHDKYEYVRTYPMYGYGAITGVADDLVDLNPVTLGNAFVGRNNFSNKCSEVTLPVGNNLLNDNLKFPTEESFIESRDTCLSKCQSNDTNCQRFCRRGWWEETRCTAPPVGVNVKYDDVQYTIPNGMGDLKEAGGYIKGGVDKISSYIKSHTTKELFENQNKTNDSIDWFVQQSLLGSICLLTLILILQQK